MDKESGVVLVTGAVGNLGRAVAAAFAARGRRLALLDRDAGQMAAAFGGARRHPRHSGRHAGSCRPTWPR